MAEHNFDRALADNAGNIVSAMCSRCGKIAKLDSGDIPDDIKSEECEPGPLTNDLDPADKVTGDGNSL
jgi:hypothetical protein